MALTADVPIRPAMDADVAAAARNGGTRLRLSCVLVRGAIADFDGVLRYLDAILALEPEAVQERGLRAGLRYQAGDLAGALEDVDVLLESKSEDLDLDRLKKMRQFLQRAQRQREAER